MFYSQDAALVFHERVVDDRPPDRFRIDANDDGTVTWVHETPDERGGWRAVWQATVGAWARQPAS